MEGIQLIQLSISWIILILGVFVLFFSPKCIYKKIRSSANPTNAERDEKLTDRKMLVYYYAIIGITIMIIGFLSVLIFSGKLTFPKF